MSTKTTFKRVALVAVASMGFGMLSVVSAFATAGTHVMTLGTATPTIPVVGTAVRIPVLLANTVGGATDTAGSCVYTPTINSVPNNSAIVQASVTADITGLGAALATGLTTMTASGFTLTNSTAVNATTTAATLAGGFSFTPDVPGEYSITIAADSTTATCTQTAVTAIIINVGGVSATQSFAGLGTTSATQISGRLVSANFVVPATTAAATLYQVTSTAGLGISSAAYGTANLAASISNHTTTTNIVKTDGSTFASGFSWTTPTLTTNNVLTAAKVTGQLSVQMSAPATAGTYYLYFKSVNPTTGVLTTAATQTVVVTAAGDTAINKAQSTISLQSAACPAAAASKSADVANYATNAASGAKAAAGLIHVCIVTRDGNGTAIAVTTASQITTSLGYIGTTATPSVAAVAAAAASSQDMYLLGVSTMTGAATVTATLIDAAGNAISLSTPVTFYGSLATMKLANKGYAAQYGGAATFGAATSGKGYLKVYGYDSAGNQIDFNDAANSTGTFTVDSSAVSTAATARTSDSAGGSVATAFASGDVAVNYGYNRLAVSCESSASEEKLTITAWGKDSLGAWVSSNSVDFYCSDNAVVKGVITVTPTDTSVVAGGATTVNFKYVDSVGYPVPDGTAVSLSASNGAGVNTPSTTTLNGAFYYPANVVAGSNGPISLLAVGTLATSGTASIAVTGGSQEASSAAADAAAEATDAANAATDAANAAAEAADAATAAAQDASDAVAALSAQVAEMIAGLKAQLTALTNLVIKIQKKVKA